jgi:hypothetical protein
MVSEPAVARQVTGREAAMLAAHLLQKKSEDVGKEVTRCRLTQATLRRLLTRKQITTEFLVEVQEWLFRVGWVLFFAGDSYAMVKLSVVNAWGRVASTRIADDIDKAACGEFDFATLEHLLLQETNVGDDD